MTNDELSLAITVTDAFNETLNRSPRVRQTDFRFRNPPNATAAMAFMSIHRDEGRNQGVTEFDFDLANKPSRYSDYFERALEQQR